MTGPRNLEEAKKYPRLTIGQRVPIYGLIGAVVLTGGERYFMLLDRYKDVSFMPADFIEEFAANRKQHARRGK